jgi:hypothetical protein
MLKTRQMRWGENVARMDEKMVFLVGEPEEKRPI